MSGRASKEKGKRGERGFRDKLREYGFVAERGWADSIDIECSLPIHFEVKLTEKLRLTEFYAQAVRDAEDKTPVVAHRSSRNPWMITLSADDFLTLVQHSDLIK